MNTGGEAAEQIVRMSLEGFEVAAKITGAGAKNIAILLYTILKEEKKTKGKSRLTNMLRSGKELKVFTVRRGDLKKFTQEAKRYGVLYCVLADRKNKDPNAVVDVIARAEDASKISRIVERFSLASVDTATIVQEAEKTKDGKSAKTEKSPLSEPTLEKRSKSAEGATLNKEKPSVKEELRKIKESRKEQETETSPTLNQEKSSNQAKQPVKKTEHKQPARRKKPKKSKGAR